MDEFWSDEDVKWFGVVALACSMAMAILMLGILQM
jgi:hypothetical protein